MSQYEQFSSEQLLSDESFINYLTGAIEKDVAYWTDWIAKHPENSAEITQAIDLFFAINNIHPEIRSTQLMSAEKELQVFKKMMQSSQSAAPVKKIFSLPLIRTAIAVAAILVLSIGGWMYFSAERKEDLISYVNEGKMIREVSLPDGTIVLLNRNAAVEIQGNYNDKKRFVKLSGAAFFKVAKNPEKPFTVSENGVETTALGTEFYVNENTADHSISVSLLEGKVKVVNGGQATELLPGEKAVCQQLSNSRKTVFNSTQLRNWTNKKIVFNKADLAEIIASLETYFNFEVQVSGKPTKMSFTGEFDANQPESLLESISFTYGIQYKITDGKLRLSLD